MVKVGTWVYVVVKGAKVGGCRWSKGRRGVSCNL